MSWVGPYYKCGICGGEIGRWPMLNLLRQEILDWRHKTVPPGTAPHRAVLGTLAHAPVVPPPTRARPASGSVEHDKIVPPDPIVAARPAPLEEIPGPAVRLIKKASDHGWASRAVYMHGPLMTSTWKFSRMVEDVVVQLHRDGHRLVACWQTKAGEDDWSFDQAWSLTHFSDPLSSPELTAAVTAPRMICGDCDEPLAMHVTLDNLGPICFDTWDADRRRQT